MVQRVATVAFEGIEARAVDVQVQVAPGLPAFKLLCIINLHDTYAVFHSSFNGLASARSTPSSRLFVRADVNARTAQR